MKVQFEFLNTATCLLGSRLWQSRKWTQSSGAQMREHIFAVMLGRKSDALRKAADCATDSTDVCDPTFGRSILLNAGGILGMQVMTRYDWDGAGVISRVPLQPVCAR
jgi:hypothetical protein